LVILIHQLIIIFAAVQLLVSAKNISTEDASTLIDETLKDHPTANSAALVKLLSLKI
jgi:hypothetical protein